MKRFLVPLLLTLLAACSQVPTSETGVQPELAPMFGTSGYDQATGLAKHSTGVYAVGDTGGNLNGTQQGNSDVFIRKLNTSGTVLWGRQFGSSAYDMASGVASDYYNNAYVVGTTYGNIAGSKGQSDAFIRKYNASGSVAWTRQFGTPAGDYARSAANYNSSIYVAGSTYGSLNGTNKGSEDAFIRQYNADGSVAWTRQFGTSAQDHVNDVAVDESGNIYVVGTTWGSLARSGSGDSDMFIRKYSPNGTVFWTRQLDYSNAYGANDSGMAVAVSGSNVYLAGDVIGMLTFEPRLIKFSSDGVFLGHVGSFGRGWDSYANDVSTDSDGNVYLAGRTQGALGGTHYGGSDGYVIKLNANGSEVWRRQIGTSAYDTTYAVLARTPSEIYAAGVSEGLLGSTYAGNGDAYLRRFNGSTGSTVWTR